jgi:hypothetical protein
MGAELFLDGECLMDVVGRAFIAAAVQTTGARLWTLVARASHAPAVALVKWTAEASATFFGDMDVFRIDFALPLFGEPTRCPRRGSLTLARSRVPDVSKSLIDGRLRAAALLGVSKAIRREEDPPACTSSESLWATGEFSVAARGEMGMAGPFCGDGTL